jgi:hypothetical protein
MSDFELYCCYGLVSAVAIGIGWLMDKRSERRRRRRIHDGDDYNK